MEPRGVSKLIAAYCKINPQEVWITSRFGYAIESITAVLLKSSSPSYPQMDLIALPEKDLAISSIPKHQFSPYLVHT